MSITVLKVLEEIEALLTPEEAFTQRTFARTAGGHPTDPTSEKATCFCLEGALYKVIRGHFGDDDIAFDNLYGSTITQLEKSSVDLFNDSPINVNDTHGHKAVLHVLQHAKKAAQPKVSEHVPESIGALG